MILSIAVLLHFGNVNPIGIRSCYDEGKRMAETLFFDYHRQNDVDIKVIRIFNTYGPNMNANDGRVVSNFIVQALIGEWIGCCNPLYKLLALFCRCNYDRDRWKEAIH